MTDRPAHPSVLTQSSPSTHLQKILSMEEWKSSADRGACNKPSSISVDGNRKLVNKDAENEVKYGMTEASTVRRFNRRLRRIFGQIFLK